MGQLNGKVGLITGAASGIGATCARMLSREGAKPVLTDLDDVTSQQIARETGRIVHESPCQIHGTITTDGATIITEWGQWRTFGLASRRCPIFGSQKGSTV